MPLNHLMNLKNPEKFFIKLQKLVLSGKSRWVVPSSYGQPEGYKWASERQHLELEILAKLRQLNKGAFQIRLKRRAYFSLLVPNYFNTDLSSTGCNILIAQALRLKEFITREFEN
jgi:hypothetical protein